MRIVLMVILGFVAITLLIRSLITEGQSYKASPNPTRSIEKNLLLPDLKLDAPRELYITSDQGVKKIHFSTTFINFRGL